MCSLNSACCIQYSVLERKPDYSLLICVDLIAINLNKRCTLILIFFDDGIPLILLQISVIDY